MTAASTSDARKRNAAQVDPVGVVARIVGTHRIQCTGLGEVTCYGCREAGWMTWSAYHRHLSATAVAALRAEGLLS